jgi:Protein of unknown function (DUF3631)
VANADDAPWAYWFEDDLKHGKLDSAASRLARKLKPYKVKPVKLRFGEDTAKGYRLADFRQAFEIYLPPREKGGTGGTRGTTPDFHYGTPVHPSQGQGGTCSPCGQAGGTRNPQ